MMAVSFVCFFFLFQIPSKRLMMNQETRDPTRMSGEQAFDIFISRDPTRMSGEQAFDIFISLNNLCLPGNASVYWLLYLLLQCHLRQIDLYFTHRLNMCQQVRLNTFPHADLVGCVRCFQPSRKGTLETMNFHSGQLKLNVSIFQSVQHQVSGPITDESSRCEIKWRKHKHGVFQFKASDSTLINTIWHTS